MGKEMFYLLAISFYVSRLDMCATYASPRPYCDEDHNSGWDMNVISLSLYVAFGHIRTGFTSYYKVDGIHAEGKCLGQFCRQSVFG